MNTSQGYNETGIPIAPRHEIPPMYPPPVAPYQQGPYGPPPEVPPAYGPPGYGQPAVPPGQQVIIKERVGKSTEDAAAAG